MKNIILLNASKDNNEFIATSTECLRDRGVPTEALFDVIIGMAKEYISQGYKVEMEMI